MAISVVNVRAEGGKEILQADRRGKGLRRKAHHRRQKARGVRKQRKEEKEGGKKRATQLQTKEVDGETVGGRIKVQRGGISILYKTG